MRYWKPGDTVRGGNVSISQEYKEHLRKEHDGSNWGVTGEKYSGDWVRSILLNRPYINTVLDYGAGKGKLGQAITGVEWTNYDPGIPDYDKLPSGRFDLVVSTDCLEHVEPAHLEAAIKEIGSKSDKVIALDIPCYPTGHLFGEGPYKGQDMHLTVEKPSWWRDLCTEYLPDFQLFEYVSMFRMSKGKGRDRVRLIYERL